MGWVQGNSDKLVGGGGSLLTVSFPKPVGIGNCVLVGTNARNGNTNPPVGVTDDKGNVYIQSDQLVDGPNGCFLTTYYLANITNSPTTLTLNLGTSHTFGDMAIDEYSNILRVTDPRDGHAINNQQNPSAGADALTSGNITTTVNGDTIWGYTSDNFGSGNDPAAGTGFTLREFDPNSYFGWASEDKVQTIAGTTAATFSPPGSFPDPYTTAVIALKAAPQQSGLMTIGDLGIGTDAAGATCQITNVWVPAGALICVWIYEKNATGSIGSTADSAGNTYPGSGIGKAPALDNANGKSQMQYSWNALPLNGGTITYTKNVSGSPTAIAALYATGIQRNSDPQDVPVSGSGFGTSTHPSSSAGDMAVNGELLVAGVAWVFVAGDTFTQDKTMGQWQAPPDVSLGVVSGVGIAGGWLVNAKPISLGNPPSYLTTLNNSRPWSASLMAFLPDVPLSTGYTNIISVASTEW